jgi:hypothetical protein
MDYILLATMDDDAWHRAVWGGIESPVTNIATFNNNNG